MVGWWSAKEDLPRQLTAEQHLVHGLTLLDDFEAAMEWVKEWLE